MKTILYHNPRCSKSREAKNLLEEQNCSFEIKEYLKEGPTFQEMKDLVKMLGIHPLELIRKGEAIYKSDYKGKEFSEQEWLEILVKHPILIERPILIQGSKAVIGRPPTLVLDLI